MCVVFWDWTHTRKGIQSTSNAKLSLRDRQVIIFLSHSFKMLCVNIANFPFADAFLLILMPVDKTTTTKDGYESKQFKKKRNCFKYPANFPFLVFMLLKLTSLGSIPIQLQLEKWSPECLLTKTVPGMDGCFWVTTLEQPCALFEMEQHRLVFVTDQLLPYRC